jgi:hypothetical protein
VEVEIFQEPGRGSRELSAPTYRLKVGRGTVKTRTSLIQKYVVAGRQGLTVAHPTCFASATRSTRARLTNMRLSSFPLTVFFALTDLKFVCALVLCLELA